MPNVTADTYTVRVEMPSFKTLNRTGCAVSPGSRVSLGHADDRRRRRDGSRQRHGRVAAHSGDDRRAVVLDHDGDRGQPAAGQPQLRLAARPRARHPDADGLDVRLAPRRRRRQQLHARRRHGHGPGVNRAAARVSVEAMQEVTVATSAYQAEYGRVERPADQRRHEERHQPVPRVAVRRRAHDRVEREQQDADSARWRAEAGAGRARLGLHDRRPGRQARRRQQAVLLLQLRAQPADAERRSSSNIPDADRCSNGRATSRRRPTTTATRIRTSRIRG